MTYPPPAGNDPFAAQPDPYAPPPMAPDPYAPPPVSGSPHSAPPVSGDPYSAPPTSGSPYAAPYASPYGPYQAAPTAGTNGMAIASLVLGIVGLVLCCCYGIGAVPGLVGAILGHIGLKQIKERGQEGRGMAIAGIATGWTAVAVAAIFVGLVIFGVLTDPNFLNAIQNGSSSSDW
jgi:hypothetical protein